MATKTIALPLRLPEPLHPIRIAEFEVTNDTDENDDVLYVSESTILKYANHVLAADLGPNRPKLRIALVSQGSVFKERQYRNGDFVSLTWDLQGLLGGKGGFGAGLRAMGKTAAAKQKPANDFSLCRDLQGNRLGAINTALLIEKAREEQASGAASATTVETDQWLLARPSWVEGAKNIQEDTAKKSHSEKHKRHAQGGKTNKPLAEATRVDKTAAFELSVAKDLEATDDSTLTAVMEGLAARKRTKIAAENADIPNKQEEDDDEVADVPEGVQVVSGRASVLLMLQTASETVYSIIGKSDFTTVTFPFMADRPYQVHLETDGLVQIGYAGQESLGLDMEDNLDGVGDVENTIGLDLVRGIVWKSGQSSALAGNMSAERPSGSLVECSVAPQKEGTSKVISLTWNGRQVAEAILTIQSSSVVPALSLERGEAVQVKFLPAKQQASSSSSSEIESLTVEGLEALGGDRLKEELKALGLKFGGTVTERAKRLLLARTLPKEDWPRSIFPS